jgi:hypothetical protein
MVSALCFYPLVLVALVWLCLMLYWAWPSDTRAYPTTPELPPSPRTREPKPFAGLTQKPHCDACQHTTDSHPQAPSSSASAYRAHAGTPPPGRHCYPFLSEPALPVLGLGGLGEYPRQWPSRWGALAPTAVHRLSRLFSGDPRRTLSWEADLT